MDNLTPQLIELLKDLIAIPSFSGSEDRTAGLIQLHMNHRGITSERLKNNLLFRNKFFDAEKPTLILNSHHDTVKANPSWTLDPFNPLVKEQKIYGLGANDAGGALVSLMATFLHFYAAKSLKYNLLLVASAEEENTGPYGMEYVLKNLKVPVEFAIVGEPTQMRMAVAEKGLMVLDCICQGQSGHAAREEGINAIYKAMADIEWFRKYRFTKTSATLGHVKMTVTVIRAGSQHNVVPDQCAFTVDVRSTDVYTNEEILKIVKENVSSDVQARSTRLQPSGIAPDHPIVKAAEKLGIETFGSPTCSDQTIMPFPSIKIGPGDSARSHTADEYIGMKELEEGIKLYIQLLNEVII